MRALVIDDSSSTRSILKRYLREMNYEVLEAGNGREALQRCQEAQSIDIALVDWNMPVMNGIDFVRALRAQKEYDQVKLMMVTTENDTARIVEALDAGANEFVMKPFTLEVLQEKMALMLNEG